MTQLKRKLMRGLFGTDPAYGDMFESERERFHASLYLDKIRRHLAEAFEGRRVALLDAGCQAGRLAIPLAKDGHRVTAVDTSGFAVRRAKKHCQEEGVSVSFVRGDVSDVVTAGGPSFDAILCIEVLYLRENWRDFLRLFRDRLRPGGLLFASHRTKFFYITQALKRQEPGTARFVLEHAEGPLWDSYFNWQTVSELQAAYRELGFSDVVLYPIGTFSEILVDPETLSPKGREHLFRIENAFEDERRGCARYLLVCASH